jgi:hypothetical protein
LDVLSVYDPENLDRLLDPRKSVLNKPSAHDCSLALNERQDFAIGADARASVVVEGVARLSCRERQVPVAGDHGKCVKGDALLGEGRDGLTSEVTSGDLRDNRHKEPPKSLGDIASLDCPAPRFEALGAAGGASLREGRRSERLHELNMIDIVE